MNTLSPFSKHSIVTRLIHASLASAITLQLLSSLVMSEPHRDRPGDVFFDVHQYIGMAALFFVVCFFGILALRSVGTEIGLLFPWFSAKRRQTLLDEFVAYGQGLRALRLPHYNPHSPLVSAIHGLGLLLMALLALTGSVYFFAALDGSQSTTLVRLITDIHETFANVAWAYLIGHGGFAVLHHLLGHMHLSEMWSLRRNAPHTKP